MGKKINFRKIKIKNIEGSGECIDIAKDLGNAIFRKTSDLGELDLARDIYKGGEIELTTEQITVITRYVQENFLAFVQEGINEQLNK